MKPITMQYDKAKKVLILTCDLSEPGELSSSGKTLGLATTHGFTHVPGSDGIFVGVNAYVKNPAYAKAPAGIASPLTPAQLEQARLVLAAQAALAAGEVTK